MDQATIREDTNSLSSVVNMRQRQRRLEQDRIDCERQKKQAEEGKLRTTTVVYGLSYSPLFQSFRDQ